MPRGPGKYDDACTAARISTGARAVVLIVLQGNKGSGFSVQGVGKETTASLPDLLRTVADMIDKGIGS